MSGPLAAASEACTLWLCMATQTSQVADAAITPCSAMLKTGQQGSRRRAARTLSGQGAMHDAPNLDVRI